MGMSMKKKTFMMTMMSSNIRVMSMKEISQVQVSLYLMRKLREYKEKKIYRMKMRRKKKNARTKKCYSQWSHL
jgi:hypothetical protein